MNAALGRPKQVRSRSAGVSPDLGCPMGIPSLANAWPMQRPGKAAGRRVHQ